LQVKVLGAEALLVDGGAGGEVTAGGEVVAAAGLLLAPPLSR